MGALTPGPEDRLLSNRTRAGRWQVEFPFGWDADDLVSRRLLLRLAVWASGALFVATGALAALGFARDRTSGSKQEIVAASQLPIGGVHYFNYPASDQQAMLLRLKDGRLVAYSSKCTHLSCSVYWSESEWKIRCPCHNGQFEPETGDPIAGPPARPLSLISLEEEGGMVYALKMTPR